MPPTISAEAEIKARDSSHWNKQLGQLKQLKAKIKYLRLNRANLIRNVGYFFQCNKGRSSHIVSLHELDTFLGCFNSLDNNIFQATATCRYGHIILGVDSAQVALKIRRMKIKCFNLSSTFKCQTVFLNCRLFRLIWCKKYAIPAPASLIGMKNQTWAVKSESFSN